MPSSCVFSVRVDIVKYTEKQAATRSALKNKSILVLHNAKESRSNHRLKDTTVVGLSLRFGLVCVLQLFFCRRCENRRDFIKNTMIISARGNNLFSVLSRKRFATADETKPMEFQMNIVVLRYRYSDKRRIDTQRRLRFIRSIIVSLSIIYAFAS